ncbi:MAG TPA: hypothetical protein VM737_09480 [Gemmatimonadota bacterium]|nr:hypothetical protein [Gemmatimonadota bacterium]
MMTRRGGVRRRCARAIARAILGALILAGCDEDNPFRATPEDVLTGESQVWELGLSAFPSAYDFARGERFFLSNLRGPGRDPLTGRIVGDWALDARADGTLILRPLSTLAPELVVTRTGIQDLGAILFDSVLEAPADGYSAADDSLGVPVVAGHVYAFRISDLSQIGTPLNYAKLEVIEVGQEIPGDPRSRFIRFRWAYQRQPLNRRLVE